MTGPCAAGATEQDSASGAETAQALLRQLAVSIAAIHAHHQSHHHHQQQQQGRTAISASQFVQEVQVRLLAPRRQRAYESCPSRLPTSSVVSQTP